MSSYIYVCNPPLGAFGEKQLVDDLPYIKEVLKMDLITTDGKEIKIALIQNVFERAVTENIKIDVPLFERHLKELSKSMSDFEYKRYQECCVAIAYYFFKNSIHPIKAVKYLRQANGNDEYFYLIGILRILFYKNGFGYKKNSEKAKQIFKDTEERFHREKCASTICGLSLFDLEL